MRNDTHFDFVFGNDHAAEKARSFYGENASGMRLFGIKCLTARDTRRCHLNMFFFNHGFVCAGDPVLTLSSSLGMVS